MKDSLMAAVHSLKRYKREAMFVIVFFLVFFMAQSLYYFSRPLGIPGKFQHTNTTLCAAFINVVTPSENAVSKGKTLTSGGFSLDIGWGCEGIEGIFIIVAALIAYRIRRREKILGIIAGAVFLFILNLVRIVILYYTVKYRPGLFDIMHIYVGQTFIIFFAVLFFAGWILIFTQPLRTTEN